LELSVFADCLLEYGVLIDRDLPRETGALERLHFSSQSGVSSSCLQEEGAEQAAGVSAMVVSSFSPALRPRAT
jgi:hypothetical protein